jgi:hypothetical protein
MYDIYRMTIKFREHIHGGMPKSEDLIRMWVESRTGHSDKKTDEQVEEAIEVAVEEEAERNWVGFASDKRGLFIYARNIKAMFRENASVLQITVKKRGSKQILQHGFEVKALKEKLPPLVEELKEGEQEPPFKADRIYFHQGKPDGVEERPIHVMTAKGPRTALKRNDYGECVELSFEVWILATHAAENRHIGEKELVAMLTLAQENGLGADRSQGHGKFDVVEFEQVQKAAPYGAEPKKKEPKPKKAAKAEPEKVKRVDAQPLVTQDKLSKIGHKSYGGKKAGQGELRHE